MESQNLTNNDSVDHQVDQKPTLPTLSTPPKPPNQSNLPILPQTPNVPAPLLPSIPPEPTDSLDPSNVSQQEQQSQISPQKTTVTKVKLSDELNIFDWLRTTDIINQIAEKAKNSVDSVITALDPGMKEYLYSGGNINIIVISDSNNLVSPIRDSFQSVFGRATVVAARYDPPGAVEEYPVKLACGFEEAIIVAQERIKRLRLDTSNVPQNQVVVVVQPTLVTVIQNELFKNLVLDENLLPRWFLTYCMIIEDPVLNLTLHSYSQFIPLDIEVVTSARQGKFPEGFTDNHLGFSLPIGELIASKLNLKTSNSEESDQDVEWLQVLSGLEETKVIHDLSRAVAHLYRRKWNDCVSVSCSTS